ncbi:glycodelin [Sorex fumeus]|uniref:glycodelin n=1 Tax=Sorex fumeus TaxID=62283 RepID=UPI0024ACE5BD|nr:glycodelin [Sorex fumeus]
MKCVLLALALVCGIQAIAIPQAMKNLDISKMAGTWHTVAMATIDPALLDTETTPVHVFKKLSVTPQANMEITMNQREMNKCVEKKFWAQKTAVPAKFQINSLEQNEMFVMDTDYQDFLMICMEKSTAPEQTLACQCLIKTLTPTNPTNDKALEKCNKAIETMPMYNKIFLSPSQLTEQCPF